MENNQDKSVLQENMEKEIEEIAKQNFLAWNEALKTKEASKVALLYLEEATFLPTVSPEFKIGRTGAEDYFKHFLEKDPVGEIVAEKVQPITPSCYLHSGMYNFVVGQGEKREAVEARFSFLWKKDNNGEWKIAHHHSSVKPK